MDETHELVADILISRPLAFSVNGKAYCLYPETLGNSVLVSGILESMEVDMELLDLNPAMEAMRLSSVCPDRITEIIAISTLPGDSCLDQSAVRLRMEELHTGLERDDMAQLLMMITGRSRWHRLTELLGLDDERKELDRISRYKNGSGGSRHYGGRSVFGILLDNACARYGWSDRYVIWEIPLDRLRMMLADSANTIYLSEDERRSLNLYNDAEMIDGDTADIETLRNLTKN